MRKILWVLAWSLLSFAGLARSQGSDDVAGAETAAASWLTLADAGSYGQSWEAASPSLQARVSKQDFENGLERFRSPTGPCESRTIESARYTHSLPGAPEGEYVVIQYRTRFADKASATETVTPERQVDGSWKVSGYFIK